MRHGPCGRAVRSIDLQNPASMHRAFTKSAEPPVGGIFVKPSLSRMRQLGPETLLCRGTMLLAGILAASLALASAQAASLRIAIQDDPDALDPATSGTYTGRFVFAAMCD